MVSKHVDGIIVIDLDLHGIRWDTLNVGYFNGEDEYSRRSPTLVGDLAIRHQLTTGALQIVTKLYKL